MKITVTWHNAGPHTIWGKLAAKLGREPTNAEATAEVKRILEEGRRERGGSARGRAQEPGLFRSSQ